MPNKLLIRSLAVLFAEFDVEFPNRDKASDGDIGNTAHQQESSDHNPDETGNVPIHDGDKVNEIHAIDVDNNLNHPYITMEMVVQFLLMLCRMGVETRLRYIIYNKRIWSASSGWVQKTYTGSSPHTEHAHFSASYISTQEASSASWRLERIPVKLLTEDIEAIADAVWKRSRKSTKSILSDTAAHNMIAETVNRVIEGKHVDFWTVKETD